MSLFETGAVIGGRYRVLKRIGAGGFGEVYLVEHVHLGLGKKFALKVLRTLGGGSQDETQRLRFEREVHLAFDLVHPNIVTIRDSLGRARPHGRDAASGSDRVAPPRRGLGARPRGLAPQPPKKCRTGRVYSSAMQVRIFTLAFSEALDGFPDETVRQFLAGKNVHEVAHHFFERGGEPDLTLVVRYVEGAARGGAAAPAAGPAEAARRDPDFRSILREGDWPDFTAHKAWRAERARRDGVPPYVVATNRLLAEVAAARPQSRAALGAVPGFGEARVARYADEVLGLVPAGVPAGTSLVAAAPAEVSP